MKSVLTITFFIITLLSVIAKAEEVPPELTQGATVYYTTTTTYSLDTTLNFSTRQQVYDYAFPIVESAVSQQSNFYGWQTNWEISYQSGVSETMMRWYYINPSQTSQSNVGVNTRSRTADIYQCPTTHPYTVSSDPQTGEPTLCTDLSPNCPSGITIGSQILTDTALDEVCTPPSSSSQYYCSFIRVEGLDHSYQPYVVYQSTGSECDSLGSNVVDDPFVEPTETNNPDPNCTAISNEIQACPADPADHCRLLETGITQCDSNCGNYEGNFVCFSEMNPSNEDGDSELEDNPNNDTDGDGNPDDLGVLQDIDKNTDELEQIGRNQIKAINALGDKLSNTGGTGVLDGGDEGQQPEECNADNLWCGIVEERPDEETTIQQIDTQMQQQLDETETFITTEQEKETELKGLIEDAGNDFIAGIAGTLPSNAGGCANVSLDLPGQVQSSTSVMCQVADPFRSMMAWAFMVLVALHGWSVFRRYFLPYGA